LPAAVGLGPAEGRGDIVLVITRPGALLIALDRSQKELCALAGTLITAQEEERRRTPRGGASIRARDGLLIRVALIVACSGASI